MERKEPTLSGIVPQKDDHEPRPARGGGNRPPPYIPPPEKSGPGFVAVFALLLALAGIGGSGYLAWMLTESQKELAEARQRIAGLETRLNIDSDESSQTLEQIQDKLEWADSEIRKLWGVSYDTNRKKITANEDSINNLTRKLGQVEKDAASARAAAASTRRELQASIDALKGDLVKAREALTTLESSAGDLSTLRENIERVAQQMPGLRDLASRVKTNEEAIAAIDSYRRNINRDILQLKEQLSSGTGGSTP